MHLVSLWAIWKTKTTSDAVSNEARCFVRQRMEWSRWALRMWMEVE